MIAHAHKTFCIDRRAQPQINCDCNCKHVHVTRACVHSTRTGLQNVHKRQPLSSISHTYARHQTNCPKLTCCDVANKLASRIRTGAQIEAKSQAADDPTQLVRRRAGECFHFAVRQSSNHTQLAHDCVRLCVCVLSRSSSWTLAVSWLARGWWCK